MPAPDGAAADQPEVPGRLIVVGALGKVAEVLLDRLLAPRGWDEILLLDVRHEIFTTDDLDRTTATRRLRVEKDRDGHVGIVDAAGSPQEIPAGDAVVLFAVHLDQLATMARWLLPQVGRGSIVFETASEKLSAMATLTEADRGLPVFGLHPLFGPTVDTIEGQTFVICPSATRPGAHGWLARVIDDAGAFVTEMSPARHDQAMAYVQTAVHQSLLAFADTIGAAGVDIGRDLWDCRTPQFEALLALASQVLSPQQQQATASIQVSSSGSRIAEERLDAERRLRSAVAHGSVARVEEYITEVREPFTGNLFERMQQASGLALAAMKYPRSLLAAARRSGDLIGIAPKGRPDRLRVGYVEQLTATTFKMRNLLVGERGAAALLGPFDAGARQLGLRGTPEVIELGLGNIDLSMGAELDELLDQWLADRTLDVRVFAPEGIGRHGLVQVALDRGLVRGAEVVKDSAWQGRREVVVRCQVRADRPAEGLPDAYQRAIDELFGPA
jgi:prephenate dehydrogenase